MFHSVFEMDDKESIVVEAENETLILNDIPDTMYNFKGQNSKKKQDVKCISNRSDGVCLSKEMCHKRSGTVGNLCKHEKSSHCCTCK